jgi:hypothetical protein
MAPNPLEVIARGAALLQAIIKIEESDPQALPSLLLVTGAVEPYRLCKREAPGGVQSQTALHPTAQGLSSEPCGELLLPHHGTQHMERTSPNSRGSFCHESPPSTLLNTSPRLEHEKTNIGSSSFVATHHIVLFGVPLRSTGSHVSPQSRLRSNRPSEPGGPFPFVRKRVPHRSARGTIERVYCQGESSKMCLQDRPLSSLRWSPLFIVANILTLPLRTVVRS